MEVALLAAHMSDRSGGPSVSVPALARALANSGKATASIIGIQDPSDKDGWKSWGPKAYAAKSRGPSSFGWAPQMLDILERVDPQVVDVQGLWMYPSVASVTWHRRKGRPYLITPRGMLEPWAVANARTKKRIASALFESRHLKNAACLRATSDMEAQSIRQFGLRNPVSVIPNTLELPAVVQTDDSDKPPESRRILFVSRIHPKKGADILLRAWSRLQDKLPNWEVVIAGPDENGHQQELEALARDLQLNRVSWRPRVGRDEKHALYRSADVFVLPTHSENFGLVIAEALANEVPVITTKNAPWSDLATHDLGWWIDNTPEDLARALLQSASLSDQDRKDMGRRGREFVQKTYGLEETGDRLFEMYAWVAGQGQKPTTVETWHKLYPAA